MEWKEIFVNHFLTSLSRIDRLFLKLSTKKLSYKMSTGLE